MDKLFELRQELIAAQTQFKEALLAEPDCDKQAVIITLGMKKELLLEDMVAKEFLKRYATEEPVPGDTITFEIVLTTPSSGFKQASQGYMERK